MAGPETNAASQSSHRKKFLTITQKRLERFVSLLAKVLVSDHPDTIHDTRVASRRLQQVFRLLFPKPLKRKQRKVVRTLRNVRRALGNCRNLDVSLDMVQEKMATATSAVRQEGWKNIQEFLQEQRASEIVAARQALAQCDIVAFVAKTRSLLESIASDENSGRPYEILKKSAKEALTEWEDALELAKENPQPDQLHMLRIACKRLRYSLELLVEIGETSAKTLIKSLKAVQNDLGQWHDRQIMLKLVTEFMMNHPNISRTFLTEIDRERHRNEAVPGTLLKSAEKLRESLSETNVRML
jgi:CHAD domain-containing protein